MEQKVYSNNPVALKSRRRYNRLSKEKRLDWSRVSNNKLKEKFEADPEYRKLHLKRQVEATQNTLAKIPEGVCKAAIKCGQPQAGESKFCIKHWVKNVCRPYYHRKNKRGWVDADTALDIWNNQKGCCAVTGLPLVPGSTATLDHRIPVSKGGTNSRENLQFVHSAVNAFKWDNYEQDFREMILEVAPDLLVWANKYSDPNNITYLFQGN